MIIRIQQTKRNNKTILQIYLCCDLLRESFKILKSPLKFRGDFILQKLIIKPLQ